MAGLCSRRLLEFSSQSALQGGPTTATPPTRDELSGSSASCQHVALKFQPLHRRRVSRARAHLSRARAHLSRARAHLSRARARLRLCVFLGQMSFKSLHVKNNWIICLLFNFERLKKKSILDTNSLPGAGFAKVFLLVCGLSLKSIF